MPKHLKYAFFEKDKQLPLIISKHVLERLAGKSHYCFVDGYSGCYSGYFQVHIAPEDQEKTTFTCLFGTYAYKRMPFGLCNPPRTFHRCMVSISSDLLKECMNDFSIYGSSFDDCLSSLANILQRCIDSGLVLNYEKCHFMGESGIVSGHVISRKGIKVDRTKIEMISTLPYPATGQEVHSFLGLASFYRRFIQNFSHNA